MPSYLFLAFTGPVEGRDEEYNDWYDQRHMQDVVSIDEFKSAQRFRLVDGPTGGLPPYLAIYEIEAASVGAARAALESRLESKQIYKSDALDSGQTLTGYFECISKRVQQSGDGTIGIEGAGKAC
jgi:hypothetical protein